MTCKCTYIAGKNVLPKNSLLYCKFIVLNEINNIKINGERISVGDKQKIYTELFEKKRKVTVRDIRNLLRLPYNKILSIYTLIIMTLLFSGNYLPRVSNNVLYKTLVV